MWEEMWENGSKNPLFIYKIQYLMSWFGTSPATTAASSRRSGREVPQPGLVPGSRNVFATAAFSHDRARSGPLARNLPLPPCAPTRR